MIPGGNLLKKALRRINPQKLQYYKNTNREVNEVGNWVAEYDDPVEVIGSFQPTQTSEYEQHGLDFNKSYFTFYTSTDVIPTTRDVSGDLLEFNDKLYQCESVVDWFQIDGWKSVFCTLTNVRQPTVSNIATDNNQRLGSPRSDGRTGAAVVPTDPTGRGTNDGSISASAVRHELRVAGKRVNLERIRAERKDGKGSVV